MVWFNLAILAASLVLSRVTARRMAPRPQMVNSGGSGAEQQEFQAPTSRSGAEIPVVFGTKRIANPNVLFSGNKFSRKFVEVSGGHSLRLPEDPNPAYAWQYYCDVHLAFCQGPIDAIGNFKFDGKLTITGWYSTNYTQSFDLGYAFGGPAKGGGMSCTLYSQMGYPNQQILPQLRDAIRAAYGQSNLQIPAYRNVTAVFFEKMSFGTNGQMKPISADCKRIMRRMNNITQWEPQIATIENHDMNPIHIIRECLTDPYNFGLGYTDADIDNDNFKHMAEHLRNEGTGISIVWDKSGSIEDFINTICDHIDATLYVDRNTGKFSIKLIRNYLPTSGIHLNESNISRIEDYSKTETGELVNTVTVTYYDRSADKEDSITIHSADWSMRRLTPKTVTKHYIGLTSRRTALAAAQRDLSALSLPLIKCTIYANRTAAQLNIGDVFTLSWGDYGIANIAMRVVTIDIGSATEFTVKITAIQDYTRFNVGSFSAVETESTAEVSDRFAIGMSAYEDRITMQGSAANRQTLNSDGTYRIRVFGKTDNQGLLAFFPNSSTKYLQANEREFVDVYNEIGRTEAAIRTVKSDIGLVGKVCLVFNPSMQFIESVKINRVDTSNANFNLAFCDRGFSETFPVTIPAGSKLLVEYDHDSEQSQAYTNPTFFTNTLRLNRNVTTISGKFKLNAVFSGNAADYKDVVNPDYTYIDDQRSFKPLPPANIIVDWLGDIVNKRTIYRDDTLVIKWNYRNRFSGSVTYYGTSPFANAPESGTIYVCQLIYSGNIVSSKTVTGDSVTFTVAEMGSRYGDFDFRLITGRNNVFSDFIFETQIARVNQNNPNGPQGGTSGIGSQPTTPGGAMMTTSQKQTALLSMTQLNAGPTKGWASGADGVRPNGSWGQWRAGSVLMGNDWRKLNTAEESKWGNWFNWSTPHALSLNSQWQNPGANNFQVWGVAFEAQDNTASGELWLDVKDQYLYIMYADSNNTFVKVSPDSVKNQLRWCDYWHPNNGESMGYGDVPTRTASDHFSMRLHRSWPYPSIHWSGPYVSVPTNRTKVGVMVRYKARLNPQNPNARILMQVGGDPKIAGSNWGDSVHWYPGAMVSRLQYLTAEWQEFCAINVVNNPNNDGEASRCISETQFLDAIVPIV